ncbi:MAG: DUF4234 domain-containing protein [Myxococcales bacterium]|nr:DUF4234 domain-containing protein [Myxococcales bacterium]MCB9734467.1 DUF4234 domain-containing protein [Deltaproteobacteria bacterium]
MTTDTTLASRAPERGVRPRSPATCAILGVITGGLYCFYWFFVTARELNEEGAPVPSGWWMLVPLVNAWWVWRWCQGVGAYTRGYLGAGTALTYLLVVPLVQGLAGFNTRLDGSTTFALCAVVGALSLNCISLPILQSTINRFQRLRLTETFD